MKHAASKAAAIAACDNGTHSTNNVGACISYNNRVLSVGWNTGDRTRLKGTLGHTSTLDVIDACYGCASVHAEVAAWTKLPNAWKTKSRGASKSRSKSRGMKKSHSQRRSTKLGGETPWCEKVGYKESRTAQHLHCSQIAAWRSENGEAVRELLKIATAQRSLQVDLLY